MRALTLLAAAAGAGLTLASSGTLMPFVIGHRGIPKIYPENTLISFQAAIDAGVDGIESDLHLTKDNVIVLLHDDTLDRTTNCTGNVWDYNYADLASCNANYASVFGDKWSFQPIPTFESIVELVAANQIFFVLDLKHNLLLGSMVRPIVDAHNATSLVAMSCWTYDQVDDAATYMNASAVQLLNDTAWGLPGAPGGNGLTPGQGAVAWSNSLSRGVRGFSIGFTSLTTQFIAQAHARLMPVYAWTVDFPVDIEAVIDLGADGILTNDAPTVIGVVQSRLSEALAYAPPPRSFSVGVLSGAVIGSVLAGILLGVLVAAGIQRQGCCKRSSRSGSPAGFYQPYSAMAVVDGA